MKISSIVAREIFNNLGWPTIECEIFLDNGLSVKASVPSGTSVGPYEALELHDGGMRLMGRGVAKAIESIEKYLAPHFIGKIPNAIEMDLKIIELDGTSDKSRLGSNATLALSMALYRAQALVEDIELYEIIALGLDAQTVSFPVPMLNSINGGKHANNNLRFQEFMIVPIGATNFRHSFENAVMVYHELENILKKESLPIARGIEGGFAAGFKNDLHALDILTHAIESAEEKYKISSIIALDVAASEFYNKTNQLYQWYSEQLTTQEMIEFYINLIKKYPIYSIEDPFDVEDILGWKEFTTLFKNSIQVVGDDIFATNSELLGNNGGQLATACIIKPNQIGTVTESLQAVKVAGHEGLQIIASHRSGDTADTFIADLAVGASAGQIKCGAPIHSERIEKYNRLLALEDDLIGMLIHNS